MTLEPLFSTSICTLPAGNSVFDTSQALSEAATRIASSPLSLFSEQPVTTVRAATTEVATTVRRAGRIGGSWASDGGRPKGERPVRRT